ncbi:hypothetical protein NA57DRAFT_78976 [Rhizodiscina lignyota]|uniref:ASST-domain-containing protein n=1 Tax=Rhizodiscina lignyota TaxID=1504668 RepID=A0A9P4M3X8_9PEZI|nr:hypothetical protein NA57DRAFT_78976 [Rhizodiscina lignyota]
MKLRNNALSTPAILSVTLGSVLAAPPTEKELCSANSVEVINNHPETWPYQSFVSSERNPPWLSINRTGEALAPGFIFLAQDAGFSNSSIKEQSPLIMTSDGNLVWAGPRVSGTTNFRTQTLFGEPVLTFWEGSGAAANSQNAGHGFGSVRIFDKSYKQIYNVCPKLDIVLPPGATASCKADIHESYITEQNTILVTAYNITTTDLTSVGGPKKGYVYDSLAVEVDVKTGEVLWTWSPVAHVPVNASHLPLDGAGQNTSNPWDWFHMNSIQPFEGNYLINSRSAWSTYLVKPSGEIIWHINGEDGGDFGKLPDGGHFSWQHMARIERESSNKVKLHYFANNNDEPVTTVPSTGVELCLTLPPDPSNPPELLKDLSDPKNPVVVYAEGSYTPLENGNTLMGYGVQPFIKEFGPNPTGADVRWSAQFGFDPYGAGSYRAYKSEWSAIPSTKPSLVAKKITGSDKLTSCAGSSKLRGYVSWNGATDVEEYKVYAGDSKTDLKEVGEVLKRGFETVFSLPAGVKFVSVGAVVKGNSTATMSKVVAVD